MQLIARASATLALLALFSFVPLVSHAQTATQDSLRASIRAAITADPRTSGMTQAQIDSLVNALALQASRQGVSSDQITWRPYAAGSVSASPSSGASCWGFPGYFCALDSALGFSGGDYWLPLLIFAAAAAFFVIVALMRHHGHPHAQFESSVLG